MKQKYNTWRQCSKTPALKIFNMGTSSIRLCLRQMDASITIKDLPILIIEANGRSSNSDNWSKWWGRQRWLWQLFSKHSLLPPKNQRGDQKFNAPCFLMELVGPRMSISGACAVEGVIHCLFTGYFINLKINPTYWRLQRFSKFCTINFNVLLFYILNHLCCVSQSIHFLNILKDGSALTYVKKIQINVFCCLCSNTADNTYAKVIIKFVQGKYGIDAHRCMASQGHAPFVLYFEKISSFHNVIVVEYIENATSLREFLQLRMSRVWNQSALKFWLNCTMLDIVMATSNLTTS